MARDIRTQYMANPVTEGTLHSKTSRVDMEDSPLVPDLTCFSSSYSHAHLESSARLQESNGTGLYHVDLNLNLRLLWVIGVIFVVCNMDVLFVL